MHYSRAFVTVCDDRYFPGLLALLNSINSYYGKELRIFVVSQGMTTAQQAVVSKHPLADVVTWVDSHEFARPPGGAWEAKQQCLSELVSNIETACLLDSDLVLLSRIDDVFALAEAGQIVSSKDGDRGCHYQPRDAVYSPSLPGQCHPYFNSGFLCLNLRRHWDILALWEFTSRFAGYSPGGGAPFSFPGHGDQGTLNAVTALLNKTALVHVLPEVTWCNSTGWNAERRVRIRHRHGTKLEVEHYPSLQQQRILHSSGPKWWTEAGRKHFAACGDVLECFCHFERQFMVPKGMLA